MFSPGGFDATLDKWSTQSVYARIKLLDHLPQHYTCIVFDRRETGQSGGRVERITWERYARQGQALLEHLGFSRAHVIGACMGCCAAAALVAAWPRDRSIGWCSTGRSAARSTACRGTRGSTSTPSTSSSTGSPAWWRWRGRATSRSAAIRAAARGSRCSAAIRAFAEAYAALDPDAYRLLARPSRRGRSSIATPRPARSRKI